MSRRTPYEGGDEELSAGEGDEEDDAFDEDMEALRRACMLVGTDPQEYNNPPSSSVAGDVSFGINKPDSSDSDDVDDLELVRNIRNRFSSTVDDCQLLPLKPMSTLPSVSTDEEEDDFETLRAIQRRFAAYESDTLSQNLNKSHQSCDYDKPVEMESSNNKLADEQTSLERSSLLAFGKSSLPKAALAFVDAIKKNRSQQKFVRSKMAHLEARIEENKKLRQRLKILKDFQVSCRRRTTCALSQKKDPRVQLISSQIAKTRKDSSKKDKGLSSMYGPAENFHVANYRMALTKFPLSVDRKKWSDVERQNLEKGIRQQFQEMVLQISVNQHSGLEGFSGNSDEFDNILALIKELDITPKKIREFLPKVNWDKLASMYLGGRSGAECEARWLNFEDPLINHNPWSAVEDKNLLFIIQQKGINNWIDIAVSLGTNRTPFECLSRYQRSLNASIIKREWTKEEDDNLRSAVGTLGVGNWQAIASTLEGRTGTQCSNRWRKSLDPVRTKKGSFSPDEDNRLKIAVLLFGPKNWNKKAEFLPGRNQVQCRERWFNCLDPSLRRCEWTEEEDSKLELAIQEHGYSWAKVAACVPSRTDCDCRRRWMKLFPNEVPLLQEARRIQKAALVSNFVDRESERPAIGPTDFQPLSNINLLDYTEQFEPLKRKKKSRRVLVLRKEKNATGSSPKTKSRQNGVQADGETVLASNMNENLSVSKEVKSKRTRSNVNKGVDCADKKKEVKSKQTRGKVNQGDDCADKKKGTRGRRPNNKRCAEQNLDTGSPGLQLNSREVERTDGICTEIADKNGSNICENGVVEKLSGSGLCFSENQNSTGSSGVSVVSEMTNDVDHDNPSILPDTAMFSNSERIGIRLPSKRKTDLDLAESSSLSSSHVNLEFRGTDGEGVNSSSAGKMMSDQVDRICKQPNRRKRSTTTSNKSPDSLVPCQVEVEKDRHGTKRRRRGLNLSTVDKNDNTPASRRNNLKKRKLGGDDTSQSETIDVIEHIGVEHHNDANPNSFSNDNENLDDTATVFGGASVTEGLDLLSWCLDDIGQEADVSPPS